MHRIDYTRKFPGILDYKRLVDAINELIDKVNAKVEIEEVTIERQVKDFNFFNWEEVKLPYKWEHTITDVEDAQKVFGKYAFSYKEMKQINDLILHGKIVSLIVNVTEEVTEKDKKQEVMFDKVETVDFKKPVKVKWKRGRPKKKTSWN